MKIPAACPACEGTSEPTDSAVPIEGESFVLKLWRYVCGHCGYIWANDAQRKHNEQEYRRKRKLERMRQLGLMPDA